MTIGIVGTGSLGTLFAEALSRVTRVEVLGRAGDPARLAEARVVLVVVALVMPRHSPTRTLLSSNDAGGVAATRGRRYARRQTVRA